MKKNEVWRNKKRKKKEKWMKNKWKINENKKMIEKTKWKKWSYKWKPKWKINEKNNFKHFQSVARCESYNLPGIALRDQWRCTVLISPSIVCGRAYFDQPQRVSELEKVTDIRYRMLFCAFWKRASIWKCCQSLYIPSSEVFWVGWICLKPFWKFERFWTMAFACDSLNLCICSSMGREDLDPKFFRLSPKWCLKPSLDGRVRWDLCWELGWRLTGGKPTCKGI